MTAHFLSALLNTKLMAYVKHIQLVPDIILTVNIANSLETELARLYPANSIQHVASLDQALTIQADLVVADLSINSHINPESLLAKLRQILQPNGMFVFATFHHDSIQLIEQLTKDISVKAITDADIYLQQLKDQHVFNFATYKEEIFESDDKKIVAANIFLVAIDKSLTQIKDFSDKLEEESRVIKAKADEPEEQVEQS